MSNNSVPSSSNQEATDLKQNTMTMQFKNSVRFCHSGKWDYFITINKGVTGGLETLSYEAKLNTLKVFMLATCMWVDHFRMSLITVALYYLKNPNRRREQVFFSPLLRDSAVWVLYFESKGGAVALWLVTGL